MKPEITHIEVLYSLKSLKHVLYLLNGIVYCMYAGYQNGIVQ